MNNQDVKGSLDAELHHLLTLLKTTPKEQRASIGRSIKEIKAKLADRSKTPMFPGSATPRVADFTIPGRKVETGHLHPITQIIREARAIFQSIGFTSVEGPEVDTDENVFQLLRMDKDHPSRDTQDTYYITDDSLLRVHTSSMQVPYMRTRRAPMRVLFPGRVYRRDQIDSTHLPSFYQLEGLMVDKNVSMTDLLGVLEYFVRRMFGTERKIRVYGHNFPYTEPSVEIEMFSKEGKWLEILGAGMVHPEVLKNGGIDPEVWRGWAFGTGIDRLAMLKWGIDDIRLLYSGDVRFLKQF